MKIDVVKYSLNKPSVKSLASVPSITRFKKEYNDWFKEPGEMYVRYVGKYLVGTWRYVNNKSTEFYRYSRVEDCKMIERLDHDFIISVIRIFEDKNNESL